jgi:hypothetical protein
MFFWAKIKQKSRFLLVFFIIIWMDWRRLEDLLDRLKQQQNHCVSFSTCVWLSRQLQVRCPTTIKQFQESPDRGEYLGFLQVWIRLQIVRGKLSMDFPERFHRNLTRCCPEKFAWLSHLDHLTYKPKSQSHSQSQSVPLSGSQTETQDGTVLAKAVLDLFMKYSTTNSQKLPASETINFRSALRHKLRTKKVDLSKAQDALATTLYELLSLVPQFARVTELTEQVTYSSTKESTKARKARTTAKDTQIVNLAVQSPPRSSLQDCVDAYQTLETISVFQDGKPEREHRITFHAPGATLLVTMNQPHNQDPRPLLLTGDDHVSVDGLDFRVVGILFVACEHFTAMVCKPKSWVIFNDLMPAVQQVPDFQSQYKKFNPVHVRLLVLCREPATGRGKSFAKPPDGLGCVNMSNIGNSCYISSIIQLLFHCTDYVDELRRGTTPEPALRELGQEIELK